MARTNTLGNFLTDVAGAIRTKKGSEEPIAAADFDTEIENLPSGGDLSEYFKQTITSSGEVGSGWELAVKKLPQFEFNGTYANSMFTRFQGEEIDLTGMDFSNTKSMGSMFSQCTYLRKITFGTFDSSKVTSMANMFYNCSQRASVSLEIDFSKINTSSVTDMSSMFNGFCRNASLTNLELDLSSFDTTSVTNMANMFNWAEKIVSLNLSSFNTSKVTNMNSMFAHCTILQHLDIRNFTFDTVTSSGNIFQSVPYICEIIVKDNTEKDWVLARRSDFINVKTVAEYEAEQNA